MRSGSWMMRGTRLLRALVVACAAVASLALSGCLWGVVRDADTGDAIVGATVTCMDADGDTFTTTTGAGGLYAFDIDDGPIPAAGPASFLVDASGYAPLTALRVIAYDDNPSATLADPSSFWETQSFAISPVGGQMITLEVVSIDISSALLAPAGGTTEYVVAASIYDADDPGGTLCHEETGWFSIDSVDPPEQAVSLECVIPGDEVEVMLYVGVRRTLAGAAGQVEEHDTSTAGFDWHAPSAETAWRTDTLDSTDTAGPDDPDLTFTAEVRYRSTEAAP